MSNSNVHNVDGKFYYDYFFLIQDTRYVIYEPRFFILFKSKYVFVLFWYI